MPEQENWYEGELQMFGSELEQKIEAATLEYPNYWEDIGTKVGLRIWLVKDHHLCHWPEEEYGWFYNKSVFLILSTRVDIQGEKIYDIHCWIGRLSNRRDYNTAMYKLVEMDTYLNLEGSQHRELEGRETELLKSYFSQMTILHGSAEHSVFNWVQDSPKNIRLLHFYKHDPRKQIIRVKEVPLQKSKLDSSYNFLVDSCDKLYLWLGKEAPVDETIKALRYAENICANRGCIGSVEVINEAESVNNRTFDNLFSSSYSSSVDYNNEDPTGTLLRRNTVKGGFLIEVSSTGRKTQYKKIKEGSNIRLRDIVVMNVCLYVTSERCFVWVSKLAARDEKREALSYAHFYLQEHKVQKLPVSVVMQGTSYAALERALIG